MNDQNSIKAQLLMHETPQLRKVFSPIEYDISYLLCHAILSREGNILLSENDIYYKTSGIIEFHTETPMDLLANSGPITAAGNKRTGHVILFNDTTRSHTFDYKKPLVAIAVTSECLATASEDNKLYLHYLKNDPRNPPFEVSATTLIFSQDGGTCIAGDTAGNLILIDVLSHALMPKKISDQPLTSLALSESTCHRNRQASNTL